MDIKSLKQFQHLAGSLSFAKTAAAMFVSPPTLTRSIMRLEQECEATLFKRNNRNVELTNAGRKLLEFTQNTLHNYHQLKNDIAVQETTISGELSFYCSVTAAQTYLPSMLDKLQEHLPGVDIKLETGDHALALERLSEYYQGFTADIAIAIRTPDFPQHVHFAPIDLVPLTLIVPASYQATNIDDIQWHNTSVVMPARGPSKRIVNHWFAEQNIRPRVYAKVSGNEAIVSMVSLGFGVGFVPRIVLENSTAQHKVRSINVDNIEPYHLGLCYLKERSSESLIRNVSQHLLA